MFQGPSYMLNSGLVTSSQSWELGMVSATTGAGSGGDKGPRRTYRRMHTVHTDPSRQQRVVRISIFPPEEQGNCSPKKVVAHSITFSSRHPGLLGLRPRLFPPHQGAYFHSTESSEGLLCARTTLPWGTWGRGRED